ncbi:hypothetical protein ACIBSV_38245 [Embleya sp. NPDC050154]|uniref:hypothetical protein n=1 Tax=Embleya sp. NPDC050154 TaxID=3363988 RepID=UPI00379B8F0A
MGRALRDLAAAERAVHDVADLARGSLRLAVTPTLTAYLTTRDAYEPHYVDDRKYFELDTFYEEFAKPWERRRLPMRHDPQAAAVDVYRRWQELNGGNRRVADSI